MNFPERLKELRQGKNLSQIALAKDLGVSSRNYQRYEYGEIEAPISVGVALIFSTCRLIIWSAGVTTRRDIERWWIYVIKAINFG